MAFVVHLGASSHWFRGDNPLDRRHKTEHPMAVVILRGLAASTLLNLFGVSSLYLRCATG